MKNIFEARGVKSDQIELIYNGINCSNSPVQIEDINTLIIVGTIMRSKGQMVAVKALKILKEKGIPMKLIIVGGVPGALEVKYLEQIKQYCSDNFLNDSVIFTGEVNAPEEYREQAQIELVCSEFEAFGRVVVEAMQMGLVVIGSDTGAIPELIENGKTGFTFQQGSAEDLSDKIIDVVTDKIGAISVGSQASNISRLKFSEKKLIESIFSVVVEEIGD